MTPNMWSRRTLLKAAGCAALGAASFSPPGVMNGQGRPQPPNLLIIHTDQQSCWTLSAYGGTLVQTPYIDSLAAEGALFRNFFTNSAV